MIVYYTESEGGPWHKVKMSRKGFNHLLKTYIYTARFYYPIKTDETPSPFIKALNVEKSPIIYDLVLLYLNNQPWIRNQTNGTRRKIDLL